ncbi:MAG: hypothetical protein AAGC88_07945 [Bacteroidota bacterium]
MEHFIVPSKRTYPPLGLERDDDNIFFTCLCLRIIKDFKLDHPLAEKFDPAVCEDFVEVIDGAKLYMFWKDHPNAYFPNGRLMHKHRFFRSPPDADDTSLIYYLVDHSPQEVENYFKALRRFANTSQKRNAKCKPIYGDKKIFSTWFGSGKMPIEFDFAVLINVFYSLEKYCYPMDDYYADSILYIRNEVITGAYIDNPFSSAPSYPNAFVLFYQVSRFIHFHPDHELNSLIPDLERQLPKLRQKAKKAFDQLLLNSSAMFLGLRETEPINPDLLEKEIDSHSSFIAGLLTLLPGKLTSRLAQYPVFHLQFICRAYNQLLVKENDELRAKVWI